MYVCIHVESLYMYVESFFVIELISSCILDMISLFDVLLTSVFSNSEGFLFILLFLLLCKSFLVSHSHM